MEITFDDLTWQWFRGNDVKANILQEVCLFRSHVLFDSGFRQNFGEYGQNFGDIQYSDFESYHIVASVKNQIVGTVRITPPLIETVARTVLGFNDYQNLIDKLDTDASKIIEINRLMVDSKTRKINLGRTLMYASIALIENVWDRNKMIIIGSAGNCTKQADFFMKHTDYEKISWIEDKFASSFNDKITFLKYGLPPYNKGSDWIHFFKSELSVSSKPKYDHFVSGYTNEKNFQQQENILT